MEFSPCSNIMAWEGMTPKVGRQPKSSWPSNRNLLARGDGGKTTSATEDAFISMFNFLICFYADQPLVIHFKLNSKQTIQTHVASRPPPVLSSPQMIGVLGGHADAQRIQDAVGVVVSERGWWQFLSHRWGLRGGQHFNVHTFHSATPREVRGDASCVIQLQTRED